jgi:Flp pilus assembly protein TadD
VALGNEGDWDGAIAEYREALHLNPNNGNAHYFLAMALERKGNNEEALAEYRAAHELAPQNPLYRQGYERLLRQVNH